MEFFCMGGKHKVEIEDSKIVFVDKETSRGTKKFATAVCPLHKTKLYKIVGKKKEA